MILGLLQNNSPKSRSPLSILLSWGGSAFAQDTHPVAGVRFTEGSKLFEHRVAEQSAEVVRRLEAKGAPLGRIWIPRSPS